MKKVEKLKNVLIASTLVDAYKHFDASDPMEKNRLTILLGFKDIERLDAVKEVFELEPDEIYGTDGYHIMKFKFNIK